jgi:hypothetical protein
MDPSFARTAASNVVGDQVAKVVARGDPSALFDFDVTGLLFSAGGSLLERSRRSRTSAGTKSDRPPEPSTSPKQPTEPMRSGPDPIPIQGGGQKVTGPAGKLGVVGKDNVIVPAQPKVPQAGHEVPVPPAKSASNDNITPGGSTQVLPRTGTGGASDTIGSSQGTGGSNTRKTVYTPRNKTTWDDPYERGRRAPSRKDVTRDPSMSEHVDELEKATQSKEKVTTKRKTKRPMAERQIHAEAGDAIEKSVVQEWAAAQPKSATVYASSEIPESIAKLYPKGPQGKGGPDAISIDPANRRIVVFDSAPAQRTKHVAKTFRYAETLKNNLPPEYQGFEVWSQEGWYKGGTKLSDMKKH